MAKKIHWDVWSSKVYQQIQATRAAVGSFFDVKMGEKYVSVVFYKDGHEITTVGHARVEFDHDCPTASVAIDANQFSTLGLNLSFECDENGKIDDSRLILEISPRSE